MVNENDQNSRTAMEVTDTNHLLTLQLKAANYEIEHMSAELHLDRHKLAESQRDVEEKSVELDEQVKKLSMCDENCSSLRGTIEDRDCTINNLEDIILDLKGIPRKEKNQIFEKKKRIEEEGETEKKEEEEKEEQNPDSNTCFLTDLDVDVHMEQVSPPVPSPTRVGFLPGMPAAYFLPMGLCLPVCLPTDTFLIVCLCVPVNLCLYAYICVSLDFLFRISACFISSFYDHIFTTTPTLH